MKLTAEQKRVLLHKFTTGDFPGQKWSTIEALFNKKLIEQDGKRIKVSAVGKDYCDNNHLHM